MARGGRVCWLTLNRPEVLNALNRALLTRLHEAVLRLAGDPEIRVLVITGEGQRAFCAGADVAEFDGPPARVYEFLRYGQQVFRTIADARVLTVAAINGYALGGGLELALVCDLRLASATARLGNPEIHLGHFPGWGATQRLPRMIGLGRAKELILLGRQITAEEALAIGLVNRVVPPDQLLAATDELAAELAGMPVPAAALAKQTLNLSMSAPLDAGLEAEAKGVALCFGTPDQIEGMAAFREKRRPHFSG